jgi:flavin-dependent dehydrogenase
MTNTDFDFVIVGARCAGASTARLLALAGARVLVVDRSRLGADTLSTSYLMRGAVMQLQRWGILPGLIAAGTPPVRTTHFHYASRSVAVDIRPAPGFDALYAPRRTVLDPLLVQAAQAAGAEVRFGAKATGLLRSDDGRVSGIELDGGEYVTAGTVIGADGVHSQVADWVDSPRYRVGNSSWTGIYGYFARFSVDSYHWYYVDGLSAGVAPTNDGLSTIFVSGPTERLPQLRTDRERSMLQIAAHISPQLGAALASARRVGGLRVIPAERGFYRQPFGPGWALVGDAGYFRDPNTAHGISDALRDSELLARALLEGGDDALERYHATRDAASVRLFHASDELAGSQWDEAQVERLLRDVSEGIRDGVRVVAGFATEATQPASMTSATQARSSGIPDSRLDIRTDSRSGL